MYIRLAKTIVSRLLPDALEASVRSVSGLRKDVHEPQKASLICNS